MIVEIKNDVNNRYLSTRLVEVNSIVRKKLKEEFVMKNIYIITIICIAILYNSIIVVIHI